MLVLFTLVGCTVPVQQCASDDACVDAFGEGATCRADGFCAVGETGDTALEPVIPQITINEVLYDPSMEDPEKPEDPLPGDSNGDGKYALDEDEFVEIVNISGSLLDISGYSLWDDEAWELDEPRHVFLEGTVLEPGQAAVVFGGGTPTGDFGGAVVEVATGDRLNLNNMGDLLRVTRADGRIVDTFDTEARSNNPDESYTRNPDIIGTFEQHGDSTPILFSPGTRVDGTPFQ